MAKCSYCGADTEMYVRNIPVCVKCDDEGSGVKKDPTAEGQRKPPAEVRPGERVEKAGS